MASVTKLSGLFLCMMLADTARGQEETPMPLPTEVRAVWVDARLRPVGPSIQF